MRPDEAVSSVTVPNPRLGAATFEHSERRVWLTDKTLVLLLLLLLALLLLLVLVLALVLLVILVLMLVVVVVVRALLPVMLPVLLPVLLSEVGAVVLDVIGSVCVVLMVGDEVVE
jgi:hypothetical protein